MFRAVLRYQPQLRMAPHLWLPAIVFPQLKSVRNLLQASIASLADSACLSTTAAIIATDSTIAGRRRTEEYL